MSQQGKKHSEFGTTAQMRSGRWQARYTHPGTGKRVPLRDETHPRGTFPNKKAALAALKRTEAKILLGHPVQTAETGRTATFGQLASGYLDARTDLAKGSLDNYRSAVRRTLAEFADRRADGISKWDVQKWWDAHEDHPVQRRNSYFVMTGVYNWAIEELDWKKPSPCRVRNAAADVADERPEFTTAQFNVVVSHLSPDLQRVAAVMFGAHLRLGEVCGLDWSDWNPKTRVLTVRHQYTRGEQKATKTRKVKKITVLTMAAEALASQMVNHPGIGAVPIFPGARSDRLKPKYMWQKWRAAATAAGFPDFRQHDVRHTSLSIIAPGATIKEIMNRGGHTTAETALRYQTADAERDRAVAEAGDGRLAAEG